MPPFVSAMDLVKKDSASGRSASPPHWDDLNRADATDDASSVEAQLGVQTVEAAEKVYSGRSKWFLFLG